MAISAMYRKNVHPVVQYPRPMVDRVSRSYHLLSTIIVMLSSFILLGLEVASLVTIILMGSVNLVLIALSSLVIASTLILFAVVLFKIFKGHHDLLAVKRENAILLRKLSQYSLELSECQFQLEIAQSALDNSETELINHVLMLTAKEEEFTEMNDESRQRENELVHSQQQVVVLQDSLDKAKLEIEELCFRLQKLTEENQELKTIT